MPDNCASTIDPAATVLMLSHSNSPDEPVVSTLLRVTFPPVVVTTIEVAAMIVPGVVVIKFVLSNAC